MARTPKTLGPLDDAIADLLIDAIGRTGLTRRELAQHVDMSMNRIGIILRKEPPPATVGEVGMLASVVGLTASEVIAAAEQIVAEAAAGVVPLRRRAAMSDPGDSIHAGHIAAASEDDLDADVEAQQTEP